CADFLRANMALLLIAVNHGCFLRCLCALGERLPGLPAACLVLVVVPKRTSSIPMRSKFLASGGHEIPAICQSSSSFFPAVLPTLIRDRRAHRMAPSSATTSHSGAAWSDRLAQPPRSRTTKSSAPRANDKKE